MGMSTHVVGIKPPDGDFHKMKTAWEACTRAGVPIPKEVRDYFDDEEPDPKGVLVSLDRHPCVSAYREDMHDGFDIDLTKLPEDIKIVRVYNSY